MTPLGFVTNWQQAESEGGGGSQKTREKKGSQQQESGCALSSSVKG